MKITAYAWQSGLIEFGPTCPEGALPIASGEEQALKKAVQVQARHAKDNKTLLVPGVPEAEGPDQQVDALLAFAERVREAMLLEAA
jgi:hypothetical protein